MLGTGSDESREKVVALLRRLDLAHYAAAIVRAGYTSSLDLCDADDAEELAGSLAESMREACARLPPEL
jgi:hypothetical protein